MPPVVGNLKPHPVLAAASRARPTTLRASPRLDVMATSKRVSPLGRASEDSISKPASMRACSI
jgi:hypothetical protein